MNDSWFVWMAYGVAFGALVLLCGISVARARATRRQLRAADDV